MADETPSSSRAGKGGWQLHVSKLLAVCTVAAIAATGALVAAFVLVMSTPPPPPDRPPPPPRPETTASLIVLTGFFVLAWLAVVVVVSRDQILARLAEHAEPDDSDTAGVPPALTAALAQLRRTLAEDHRADLAVLEERITALTAEYGEQRETDGYIDGMRVAATAGGEGGEVRQIRRVPAP